MDIVHELTETALAEENLALHERIADLEVDNRTLRLMVSTTLAQLQKANELAKALTRRVRALTDRAGSLPVNRSEQRFSA